MSTSNENEPQSLQPAATEQVAKGIETIVVSEERKETVEKSASEAIQPVKQDEPEPAKENKKESEQEANKEEDEVIGTTKTVISDEELNQLKKYLPYFHEFINKPEQSVLNMSEYNENPDLYLQAILKKYNVDHPKAFQSTNKDQANLSAYQEKAIPLRPWIEGVLEKLMPEKNLFGQAKWDSRLFRLFDEALVWFDEPSIVTKWWTRKELTMKPLGVLPLAMVTSIETADLSETNTREVSDEELFSLTLHVGDEGVIMLRCSDVPQRLKWFECLHCAVFNVPKPLFATKEGIWRLSKEHTGDIQNQWTKHAIQEQMQPHSSIEKMRHIRMGTSLVVGLKSFASSGGQANNQLQGQTLPLTSVSSQRSTQNANNITQDASAVELQSTDIADLKVTEKKRESHLRKDSKVL